jgi:hypothetical protein
MALCRLGGLLPQPYPSHSLCAITRVFSPQHKQFLVPRLVCLTVHTVIAWRQVCMDARATAPLAQHLLHLPFQRFQLPLQCQLRAPEVSNAGSILEAGFVRNVRKDLLESSPHIRRGTTRRMCASIMLAKGMQSIIHPCFPKCVLHRLLGVDKLRGPGLFTLTDYLVRQRPWSRLRRRPRRCGPKR